MILGIAGPAGAGKDLLASLLEQRGFTHISVSDLLRQEMDDPQFAFIERDRGGQRRFANFRRAECGGSHYLQLAAEEISLVVEKKPESSFTVTGIYTAAEAEYLQMRLGGKLLFVDAPADLRFTRVTRRADGPRDALTRAEFDEADQREMSSGRTDDEVNLQRVRALAWRELSNTGTVEQLKNWVDALLTALIVVRS